MLEHLEGLSHQEHSHQEHPRREAPHHDAAHVGSPGLTGLGGGVAEDESATRSLELLLRVRDPGLVEKLAAFESPREREEFALAALRIGVMALDTARGQVDAGTVHREVERMLGELRHGLDQHRSHLKSELEGALREYFDPRSGRFAERVEALTHEDGELAQVIRSHVQGSDSALARTLANHVGAESPLLRILDPNQPEGLVAEMTGLLEQALGAQRERILAEFSLDNSEGSLRRLVSELQENHGRVGDDLQERIDTVVKEFSLDDEDSALSRLVHRVERAQQQITDEFTLDSDTSALARMRRELMEHAQKQTEAIAGLEKRVAAELATLHARRETDAKTPRHGTEFEAALVCWLRNAAGELGDLFTDTSQTTGVIRNRKVGDAVLELGPEHQAAGARIVVEAKEVAGTSLAQAREEIEVARRNRSAEIGIFVLSAGYAPEGWRSFQRIGNGIFVTWDPDDPASDVWLEAALSVARTLCTRSRDAADTAVDFPALERAIREVEKQMEGLDEMHRAAETIESGSGRIKKRLRIMRGNLIRAVETLDRCSEAARLELRPSATAS